MPADHVGLSAPAQAQTATSTFGNATPRGVAARPSPAWVADTPIVSPQSGRSLAVVRLIRKEEPTCCRFFAFFGA